MLLRSGKRKGGNGVGAPAQGQAKRVKATTLLEAAEQVSLLEVASFVICLPELAAIVV